MRHINVHERWHVSKLEPDVEFHLQEALFRISLWGHLHRIRCVHGKCVVSSICTLPSKIQDGRRHQGTLYSISARQWSFASLYFGGSRASCRFVPSETIPCLYICNYWAASNAWDANYCDRWPRGVSLSAQSVCLSGGRLFLPIRQIAPLRCGHYYITVTTCCCCTQAVVLLSLYRCMRVHVFLRVNQSLYTQG